MPSDFNVVWIVVVGLISLISTINGIYMAWSNRSKQEMKDTKIEVEKDVAKETELGFSIDYIRRSVDDIKTDLRSQNDKIERYTQKMDEKYERLNERLIVVEHSVSSAHKRIDEIK